MMPYSRILQTIADHSPVTAMSAPACLGPSWEDRTDRLAQLGYIVWSYGRIVLTARGRLAIK
jgi:Mn-dependent DtxR family transcriptional regulator